MYQSRPPRENTNTLGISQRNLIQKFDYTGDGITKEANRRYWGNSEISHSRKPLGHSRKEEAKLLTARGQGTIWNHSRPVLLQPKPERMYSCWSQHPFRPPGKANWSWSLENSTDRGQHPQEYRAGQEKEMDLRGEIWETSPLARHQLIAMPDTRENDCWLCWLFCSMFLCSLIFLLKSWSPRF